MKFILADKFMEIFPDTVIGVVIANNIDNERNDNNVLQILRNEEKTIKEVLSLEKFSEYPFIRNWRKTFKTFGAKDYRSSHEALIKRILKGGETRQINKLVDLYNSISLKYKTPVGGDDLNKTEGNMYVKLAEGNERFIMLGSDEASNPKEGEVVYADENDILCRRWNWREANKAKFTEQTKRAILFVDAIPPLTEEIVRVTTNELTELVEKHCNAETQVFILNKNNREIEF
jgi:DNA/RNA-binding domain of Phe-tRNA-synthetase-like protein